MSSRPLDEDTKAKLKELEEHMLQASEKLVDGVCGKEPEEVWSLEAMLVRLQGEQALWTVPANHDWEHDMLDGTEAIAGTLYADNEPFTPNTVAPSGYFQAASNGKWLRIDNGKATLDASPGIIAWKDELSDFPEVAAQMQAAMERPKYRHVIERHVIRSLADGELPCC